MAASKFVTDAEIVAFIPGASIVGGVLQPLSFSLIAPAIEELIECECNRVFLQAARTDEIHYVNYRAPYGGFVVQQDYGFFLNYSPITAITRIRQVLSRDVAGVPSYYIWTKDQYWFEPGSESRFVHLIVPCNLPSSSGNIDLMTPRTQDQRLELWIDYTAGYPAGNLPKLLKLVFCEELSRAFKFQQTQAYHQQAVEGEAGTIRFQHDLTADSKRKLSSLRLKVYG